MDVVKVALGSTRDNGVGRTTMRQRYEGVVRPGLCVTSFLLSVCSSNP